MLSSNSHLYFFKWIAFGTSVFTWPLISFGAFVRLKGAGLACPDWPLCYGKLIPPPGIKIAMEVGHRFVAVILGILIIILVFYSWKMIKDRVYFNLSLAALILVCFQGLLGALTVTEKLSPKYVTGHLIGGNLLFSLLVFITGLSFYMHNKGFKAFSELRNTETSGSKFVKITLFMNTIFYLMLLSGGINSSTYSGYVCEAFPGCHQGSWMALSWNAVDGISLVSSAIPKEAIGLFFPQHINEWIHMGHRFIVISGSFVLIYLSFFTLLKKSSQWKVSSWTLIFLITSELIVGVLNALYRVPKPISILHTALAASITGVLAYQYLMAKCFQVNSTN